MRDLGAADPDGVGFAAAVDVEARRRLARFMDGVVRYRRHPRGAPTPPVSEVWRRGTTRLLDYGADARAGDFPVLIVPSLVNRGYILDLSEKRSLLRHLAADGWRPFLIDWDTPGAAERAFGLTEYVGERLEPAAGEVRRRTGHRPAVVGYCMGGLLAMALAARKPDDVSALALLATPWDFHAIAPATTAMLRASVPALTVMLDQWGVLPVDVVQSMFTGLDPYLTADKFRRFAAVGGRSARAGHFVRLEDWLNDGVPLAGPAARECIVEWYVENRPAEGRWRIGGDVVLPRDIAAPALVVIPENDHIVPPASAAVLADAIPGATAKWLGAGHIGMVAGSRAKTALYKPLSRWLHDAVAEAG